MRKILILLPLVLLGCSGESDVPNEWAYQAPPDQAANPAPGPAEPLIFDPDEYVPIPAIITDDGWTARLKGLPVSLSDVVWSGERFIAVGEDGVILTSEDGIDWAQQGSGTNADLANITSYGTIIVVVGHDGAVLLSTDHGENWTVKHSEDGISLYGVVVNDWQIVTGGRYRSTAGPYMMRSEDRGETWSAVDSLPPSGHWIRGLVYAGGMFVAATDSFSSPTSVWVSVDGKDWQDIVLWDDPTAGLFSILHDGNKFIVAGSHGAVFTSADGAYWVESETPLEEISYQSAAWNGSELMLAGGITWWYWWVGEPRSGPLDVGLSSTDGGLTWRTFNIDGYFESSGMAWGNDRFVAVGMSSQLEREGAVYTLD